MRSAGVIDCPLEASAIADAITQALTPSFQDKARSHPADFGDGHAGQRIVDILERTDFTDLARKSFIDLAWN